jgi:uncharacterized protein YbaR (Trm112 family)
VNAIREEMTMNTRSHTVISKDLLKILQCPENRTPLELAPPDVVARLNEAVAAGTLRNRAGEVLDAPLDGALIRQDRTLAYPIVDAIPVLLIDEAIPLEQIGGA